MLGKSIHASPVYGLRSYLPLDKKKDNISKGLIARLREPSAIQSDLWQCPKLIGCYLIGEIWAQPALVVEGLEPVGAVRPLHRREGRVGRPGRSEQNKETQLQKHLYRLSHIVKQIVK